MEVFRRRTVEAEPQQPRSSAVMGTLEGLALTRSERVIVVALSYAWCTPLFFWFGERMLHYLRALQPSSNQDEARG